MNFPLWNWNDLTPVECSCCTWKKGIMVDPLKKGVFLGDKIPALHPRCCASFNQGEKATESQLQPLLCYIKKKKIKQQREMCWLSRNQPGFGWNWSCGKGEWGKTGCKTHLNYQGNALRGLLFFAGSALWVSFGVATFPPSLPQIQLSNKVDFLAFQCSKLMKLGKSGGVEKGIIKLEIKACGGGGGIMLQV